MINSVRRYLCINKVLSKSYSKVKCGLCYLLNQEASVYLDTDNIRVKVYLLNSYTTTSGIGR